MGGPPLTTYGHDSAYDRRHASATRQAPEAASIPGRNGCDGIDLADGSGRSACDCEFVALAEVLDVPLVTADPALCASFPERTVELEAFAG